MHAGRALLLLCALLLASMVVLGACTGPGLEPPGGSASGSDKVDAGANGPVVGGAGGKGSQDSGGGMDASGTGGSATGSADAGTIIVDAGTDSGFDDEDAGTLR